MKESEAELKLTHLDLIQQRLVAQEELWQHVAALKSTVKRVGDFLNETRHVEEAQDE